jgi:ribosomal protein L16 Arg81 hydroxylase
MKFEDLLAPMSHGEFLEKWFRARPLHLPGAVNRMLGAEHFGWHTANRLLGIYRHTAPGFVDVGIHRNRAREVTLVPDKRSEVSFTYNDTVIQARVSSHYFEPESLAAAMRRGAAVIVNDAHVLDEDIRQVAVAVEDFAKGRAFCNVYINSPKQGVCEAHVDAHDLFVLHIAGVGKVWRFHEFFKPDIQHNLNPVQHGEFAPGNVTHEIELAPGDALYVPWGQAHSVVTTRPSMHMSFGFTPLLRDRPEGGRIPRYRFDLPRELE